MTDDEKDQRLKRAAELLREWRDKYGGKEHYAFGQFSPADRPPASASPTDLVRDTQRWIEGK